MPLGIVHLDTAAAKSDFTTVCRFKDFLGWVTEDDRDDIVRAAARAFGRFSSHGVLKVLYKN